MLEYEEKHEIAQNKCCVGSFDSRHRIDRYTLYYNRNKIRQEYLAKGIYEVGDTFSYVAVRNGLFAYYMICEPPAESDELVQVVLQYIQENDIVQALKNRLPERDVDGVTLAFVEPSKDFPIGWNSGEATGWDGEKRLGDHTLIRVTTANDVQSQNAYLITLGRNENQKQMIVDIPE